jgi:hypothetical protein
LLPDFCSEIQEVTLVANDYIVGAGASASVLKKIFPDAKVISPAVSQTPDLFYLWDTPAVRRFFAESKMSVIEKLIHVGYKPKITPKALDYYNRVTFKTGDSVPSNGKTQFYSLLCRIEPVEICKVDIVKNILFDNRTIVLEKGETLSYDHIFWTAPHDKALYSPISFIEAVIDEGKSLFEEDYVYLFYMDLLKMGIYRIEKKMGTDKYVIEVTGHVEAEKTSAIVKAVADKFGVALKFQSMHVRQFGHIRQNVNLPDNVKSCVYFFGRYAQVNCETMISDVIQKAYDLKEELLCS